MVKPAISRSDYLPPGSAMFNHLSRAIWLWCKVKNSETLCGRSLHGHAVARVGRIHLNGYPKIGAHF
jgi:hypothetical protein